MVLSKKWIIKTKPPGLPTTDNFEIVEENLPECKDGDIILESEYISVDPYIRYRIRQSEEKAIVAGSQIAKVIESKNENYPIGTCLVGYLGWRTCIHVSKIELEESNVFSLMKIPEIGSHPRSAALGILGMPGNTAYFGLLEICQPKEGDTVCVNAAAGAVGSAVCQIAKIKGCRVIAFAGSEAKIEWLKELGVDHAFNYNTVEVSKALKETAPDGINCYFDNVGGQFTAQVLPSMAEFGRVAICGCISIYNQDSGEIGISSLSSPYTEPTILWKQLKVEGFIVSRWRNSKWFDGISQLKRWLDQGELKYRESVTTGFENVPKAFIGLFAGNNIGKAIVKM